MNTRIRATIFMLCISLSGVTSAGQTMRSISAGRGDDGQIVRPQQARAMDRVQLPDQAAVIRSLDDGGDARAVAMNVMGLAKPAAPESDPVRRILGERQQEMLRELERSAAVQQRSEPSHDSMMSRLMTTLDEKGRRPVTIGGAPLRAGGTVPIAFRNKPVRIFGRQNYESEIAAATLQHGVDEALVRTIIHVESAYKVMAKSHMGARGLMQLMPPTAKRFGVVDSYDPRQNIQGGTRYLAFLLKRYKGNITLAAAAYNAGEGAVDRHGGVPPYRETRGYVEKVAYLLPFYRSLIHS